MSGSDGNADFIVLDRHHTLFPDISQDVVDIDPAPIKFGGFCDVHRGSLRNGQKVACKKLRVFGGEFEKVQRVSVKTLLDVQ